MKKNNIITLVMVMSLSFLLSSCYYDKELMEEVDSLPETVSYSADIQPIWDMECISCHAGGIAPDLTSGNSYDELMDKYVVAGNPEESIVYKTLVGEAVLMPTAGKMSQSKINLVYQWILDGALNN